MECHVIFMATLNSFRVVVALSARQIKFNEATKIIAMPKVDELYGYNIACMLICERVIIAVVVIVDAGLGDGFRGDSNHKGNC